MTPSINNDILKGALCPVGAICQRNSYAQPSSKAGFWKDALDITEGDETVVSRDEPLIEDDRMSKRALDDMKRALGESANSDDVRRPACAPERVLRIFSDMTDSSEVVPLDMEDQLKNPIIPVHKIQKVIVHRMRTFLFTKCK